MGDNGKKRLIVEPHSPYLLHPSKGPGVVITVVIFHGKNCELWKRVVTMALKAKNKLEFIDSTCRNPRSKMMKSFQNVMRGTRPTLCCALGFSISSTINS